MRRALRKKRKSAWSETVLLAAGRQFQFALEHVKEPLCGRGAERSIRSELRRHLREARAQLRRCMDHKIHTRSTRQWRAYERVRRVQQVIRLQAASR